MTEPYTYMGADQNFRQHALLDSLNSYIKEPLINPKNFLREALMLIRKAFFAANGLSP